MDKPRKPRKPQKPRRMISRTIAHSTVQLDSCPEIKNAQLREWAEAGYDVDLEVETEWERGLEWNCITATLSTTEEVEDPHWDEKMKEYESKLEKYESKLKDYKRKLVEWEQWRTDQARIDAKTEELERRELKRLLAKYPDFHTGN